jgi:hypothetical protein
MFLEFHGRLSGLDTIKEFALADKSEYGRSGCLSEVTLHGFHCIDSPLGDAGYLSQPAMPAVATPIPSPTPRALRGQPPPRSSSHGSVLKTRVPWSCQRKSSSSQAGTDYAAEESTTCPGLCLCALYVITRQQVT